MPSEKSYWRQSDGHAHHNIPKADSVTREARYKGLSVERGVYYFLVENGEESILNDKVFAAIVALSYLHEKKANIANISIITHFGFNYDFRNKRLHAWRVDFENKDIVFVDRATQIIVDHTINTSRYECYSFSFLY